jgi:hypothetical protein
VKSAQYELFQESHMNRCPQILCNAKVGLFLFVAFLAVASTRGIASQLPKIKVVSGANQQTSYAAAFPAPLLVLVTDPIAKRALPGVRVNFTPAAGIGLNTGYTITDARGMASVTATGLTLGSSNVTAVVAKFPAVRTRIEGLTVRKATLTVLPADMQTTVGVLPAITSYSLVGFVNGETAATANVTGTPKLTTTAHENSRHANYAIKGGVGSLWAPNYIFVAGFGTLAVMNGADVANQHEQAPEPTLLPSAFEEQPVAVRQAVASQTSTVPAAPVKIPAAVALPPVTVSLDRAVSDAPVRAAIAQSLAKAAAAAQLSDARPALVAPVQVAAVRKDAEAPVRAAIAPVQFTTLGNAQSPHAQSEIRKAFKPSGLQ